MSQKLLDAIAVVREHAQELQALQSILGNVAPAQAAAQAAAPAPVNDRLTFKALWEKYVREEGRFLKSAKTDRQRSKVVLATRLFVNGAEREFGNLLVTETTKDTIFEFLERQKQRVTRHGRPTKPATRNRYLALIKKTFAWAAKERVFDANPAYGIPLEAEDNIKKTKLPPDAFDRLLTFCNPISRAMALCYYDSGNRMMEIVNLRWPDFDHQSGRFYLFGSETKSGKGRPVKLSKRALEAVLALPRICAHVFANPKTGKRYCERHLYRAFELAVSESGLHGARGEKITFHTLRHQFARNGRKAGIPEPTLMAMGGWKTRSAFERYGIVDDEETNEAFDRLHQAVGMRIGPKRAEAEEVHENRMVSK